MDNLSAVDKLAGPNVSFIERFHCIYTQAMFKSMDSSHYPFVGKVQPGLSEPLETTDFYDMCSDK